MKICPKCGFSDDECVVDLFSDQEIPSNLSDQGRIDYSNLSKILKWAETNKEFDAKFIQSLKQGLEKFPHLTERQRGSVDNIAKKFRIF